MSWWAIFLIAAFVLGLATGIAMDLHLQNTAAACGILCGVAAFLFFIAFIVEEAL